MRTKRTASMSRSGSISSCGKFPSPDQFVMSVSSGGVNGHQPAEHGVMSTSTEPARLEHPPDRLGAGILTNRRRNVPIGVGIAVEGPTERRTDDGEIQEVSRADQRVGRAVEIGRQALTTRREDRAD